MLPMPTLAGQVMHAITVPLTANLIGFTFHAQGFVLYQPTGAAVSNALTGIVGT